MFIFKIILYTTAILGQVLGAIQVSWAHTMLRRCKDVEILSNKIMTFAVENTTY